MARSIDYSLKLATGEAARELKRLADGAEDVADELDDVETAGRAVARALERTADDIEADLKSAERAAEALGEALGPELAGKLGNNGVDGVVADLKRLGLTYDEIEADADELARAVAKLDTVGANNARGLNVKMAEVADNTGKASDATRSFVGNAVGELPAAAGAFGPVSEAASQLTEGLLEGEISAKNLASALGPIALVGLATTKVIGYFQQVGKTKAWESDQVEAYAEALGETADGAAAVAAALRDAEKVELNLGNAFGRIDIAPALAAAGVSLAQFSEAVAGGEAGVERLAEALAAAGVEDAGVILSAATQQSRLFGEAQERAAIVSAVFGDEAATAAGKARDLTGAIDANREAAEEQNAELETSIGLLEEAADAILEQIDAQRAAADAGYELRDATEEAADAIGDANELTAFGAANADELADAYDRAREAAAGVADAEVRVAEETATANGETLTATGRQDIWNKSMLGAATTAAGPLRRSILDYIGSVNGIPPEKLTEIEAALDRGDIDYAETELGRVSRTRRAAVEADANTGAAERELNELARRRVADIVANIITTTIGYRKLPGTATGTSSAAKGPTLVGETGPEIVEFAGGERVRSNIDSRALLGAGAPVTIVEGDTYVTLPAGTDPTRVVRSDRQWQRRNGPR
jgi:hypothetical protein